MITITRRLEWDAGHRVLGHEGRCRHIHGHRYVAEITVRAEKLDGIGRVIDFSVVKTLVGGWIDTHWDHNLMLHPDDPQRLHLQETEDRPPYVMRDGNPTAENIAEELGRNAIRLLADTGVEVVSVRIWETPNCHADWYNR